MMLNYRTPGVYFEWLEPRAPAVEGLPTDVAGFVGIAERGLLHQAVRVTSWQQYVNTFGGHIANGYLAYAVAGFFANGGRTCYVVRTADEEACSSARVALTDAFGRITLRLFASSPGAWGNAVQVSLNNPGGDDFTLLVRGPGGETELWPNLTLDSIAGVLSQAITGSRLVRAEVVADAAAVPALRPPRSTGWSVLKGGADGLATLARRHLTGVDADGEYSLGLGLLRAIDEVSFVAIPDIMDKPPITPPVHVEPPPDCEDLDPPPSWQPPAPQAPLEFPPATDVSLLQRDLIAHCETLRDRVAILDCPVQSNLRSGAGQPASYRGYAATYYPWLLVGDPLRLEGLVRPVPPSGHVAGVYARMDVHMPPANAALDGALDLTDAVEDARHGDLNESRVNVIRAYPGRGVRVAGARTLSHDSLYRYVNVRRLLNFIEESIEEATQWTVFEPNGPDLWRDVDRVVRSFLDGLWRRGMLDGKTAGEAYSVRCDETTNPPSEVEQGRVTTYAGIQPPWPAEFVLVRIQKTLAGTTTEELAGAGNA